MTKIADVVNPNTSNIVASLHKEAGKAATNAPANTRGSDLREGHLEQVGAQQRDTTAATQDAKAPAALIQFEKPTIVSRFSRESLSVAHGLTSKDGKVHVFICHSSQHADKQNVIERPDLVVISEQGKDGKITTRQEHLNGKAQFDRGGGVEYPLSNGVSIFTDAKARFMGNSGITLSLPDQQGESRSFELQQTPAAALKAEINQYLPQSVLEKAGKEDPRFPIYAPIYTGVSSDGKRLALFQAQGRCLENNEFLIWDGTQAAMQRGSPGEVFGSGATVITAKDPQTGREQEYRAGGNKPTIELLNVISFTKYEPVRTYQIETNQTTIATLLEPLLKKYAPEK